MRVLRIKSNMKLLPKYWSAVHEVKHLGRVEELLETAKKPHALVVPTLTIDKDQ